MKEFWEWVVIGGFAVQFMVLLVPLAIVILIVRFILSWSAPGHRVVRLLSAAILWIGMTCIALGAVSFLWRTVIIRKYALEHAIGDPEFLAAFDRDARVPLVTGAASGAGLSLLGLIALKLSERSDPEP